MEILLRVLIAGILLGGIYALVAMGLNLIFGVVKVVNFAHGELVMLGMYGAYAATTFFGVNVYASILLVTPVLMVLGALIQRFIVQPLHAEPSMQLVATFGLLLIFQNVMLTITGGKMLSVDYPAARETFQLVSVRVDFGRLAILIVATVIAIGLWLLLSRARFGFVIRAVSEDHDAARLMGINVERVMVIVFGLGAALAGLAGVMLSPVYSTTPTVGANFVFAAFAVVVLGGLGSVAGAYLGGLIIGVIEAAVGYYLDPSLGMAAYFVVFLIVLLVRPNGLLGRVGAEKLGASA